MTTKYTAQILDTDMKHDSLFKVASINYVNSIPGAGKTYAALHIAKQTLHNGDNANHVLVYAAPTHKLLKQFHSGLLKRATPAQAKRIKLVDSRELNGQAVAQRFHSLLNGSTDHSISIKKVPNGTVLLVTHDCLRLTALDMPGKERVSLIFDEARQCMQETLKMDMPPQVLAAIRSKVVIEEALPDTTITRWSWAVGSRLDENTVRTLWKETHPRPSRLSIDKCMKFVNNLKNASQHIWVAIDGDADRVQDFQVNVTLSPSRLFANYGKVLIMSAFFEHSQMYHMLKRQECDLTTSKGRKRAITMAKDGIMLNNVTDVLIDDARVKRITKQRMGRATLTYVLEDESLSKYHLQRGIVVPRMTTEQHRKLSLDYMEAFEGTGSAPEFKKFWQHIQTESEDTHSIPTSAYRRRDILVALKPSKLSVVQYMAKQSVRLQAAWLNANNKEQEPLLLCVNAKESSTEHSTVWDKERLDDLLNQGANKRVMEVPVVNQGLNRWKNFNTAAFMATVKMTPGQITFLKTLLPEYNPDLDRTVDQCIQFIFRSSLRKAESTEACFLIVSDKKLSAQVNMCLGNHMKVVSPESLLPKWRQKSIATLIRREDPEVVRERNRKHQSTTLYKMQRAVYDERRTKSSYGKEYRRITSVIKRRTDRLVNDPKNRLLINEIAALREERSNLEK